MTHHQRPPIPTDQPHDCIVVARLIAGLCFNCAFLLFLIVSIPIIVLCWLFAY